MLPFEEHDEDSTTLVDIALPVKVILYDDEWHSMDEVIQQLMIATNCSAATAERITFEAHHTGKAIAYQGEMGDCLRVSAVLEEISLHTQVEV